MDSIELYTPLLYFPGSLAIIGASHSGKTSLLVRIIKYKDQVFTKPPKTVVYCHAENTTGVFGENSGIVFHKGLPSQEVLESWIESYSPEGWLLCLDDLSNEFYSDDLSHQLLSRLCHHNSCYLITIGHNLFASGKYARFASLQYHGFLLCRNCRDLNQYQTFGRQILGTGRGRKFLEAFMDATELGPDSRAGYLFVNLHPLYSNREMICFKNILPDDPPLIGYKFT